jgi:hypothetical protein
MRRITCNRVDHERSARRDAVQPAQHLERSPGFVVVAAAVLALLMCVADFALGKAHAGVAAAIIGLLAFGAGLSWLGMDRRRIRDAERHRRVGYPGP